MILTFVRKIDENVNRLYKINLKKYFVHLNWIRLATNPSSLDNSIGGAAISKPEDASSKYLRIPLKTTKNSAVSD